MAFKSIFSRMFVTYVAIILVVLMAVSGTFSIFMYNYTVNHHVESIMELSETVEAMTVSMQIEDTNARDRRIFRHQLDLWSRIVHADIVMVNSAGRITDSSVDFIDAVPERLVIEVMNGNIIETISSFGNEYESKVLTVGIPMRYNGNIVGATFFNSMLPRMYNTFWDLFWQFFASCTISVCLACILVYLQARKLSRSINAINFAVQDIAAGNFGERVKVTSRDEIGQLASSFNFMADSIEDLENQRSSFVSDVSHELRTPMTSIAGFVQSILDGTVPEDQREKYLKIVLDESLRLKKLVSDMLDMSRMSSSEYQLTIEEFDLNELVRLAIVGLYNKVEEHNLEINFNGDGDEDFDEDYEEEKLMVIADKDSIMRVLINIIDNAVKFSYPNTTIGIKTWKANKKIYVSIGNYGVGIDGSDLSNIFNRFYKTDKSRNKVRSGAGLGLSMVKNILTLHKQSIWVESVNVKDGENVKYTKFTFTLEPA